MPPDRAARQGSLRLWLLLQALALPDLLTDGRVQQAAGGDRAMPEHAIAVGVHRKEQGLCGKEINQ